LKGLVPTDIHEPPRTTIPQWLAFLKIGKSSAALLDLQLTTGIANRPIGPKC